MLNNNKQSTPLTCPIVILPPERTGDSTALAQALIAAAQVVLRQRAAKKMLSFPQPSD